MKNIILFHALHSDSIHETDQCLVSDKLSQRLQINILTNKE